VKGDTRTVPIQTFVHMLNEAGGITNGKRAEASLEQLQKALEFGKRYISDYQRRTER
jgi:hypothetical protein